MRLEPDVKALERNLRGKASMLRVSIHSQTGKVLRARYQFNTTPTFIIFDGEGREVWRGSCVPSVAEVLDAEFETVLRGVNAERG